MSTKPKIEASLRDAILTHSDAILDDKDVMRALIAANERSMGGNIIDMRGIAMDRLETRLDRLEDTHRSVIAAAYENLAGTQQIHRAILRMMEAQDLETLLQSLGGELAEILRVDAVRLILETRESETTGGLPAGDGVFGVRPKGYFEAYVALGRAGGLRRVTLRQLAQAEEDVFGKQAAWIRSEACLLLDLGEDRLPGLLVLGSEDPHMFDPHHGTDLLAFFAGVFERVLRRWLP